MKIIWTKDFPGNGFSSYHGTDEMGNKYFTPANQETVTVKTIEGGHGQGWTAEEALQASRLLAG